MLAGPLSALIGGAIGHFIDHRSKEPAEVFSEGLHLDILYQDNASGVVGLKSDGSG